LAAGLLPTEQPDGSYLLLHEKRKGVVKRHFSASYPERDTGKDRTTPCTFLGRLDSGAEWAEK
jgi:hypothetical protein